MENNHISYFKVENFKCFDSFEMNDIGQFNLIAGDNNVGKTSVLEALLFDENLVQTLLNFSAFHGLRIDARSYGDIKKTDYLSSFVNNFDLNKVIRFVFSNVQYALKFKHGESLSEEDYKFIRETFPTLNIEGYFVFLYKYDDLKEYLVSCSSSDYNLNDILHTPDAVPNNIGFSSAIVGHYSEVISQNINLNNKLVYYLKGFIGEIVDIRLIEDVSKQNKIMIQLNSKEKLYPLTSFGDGAIKLLRILLKIMTNKSGRMTIDEFEAGIHFSRFKTYWKMVIKVAHDHKVQLFATTHSLECMKYFKEALEDEDMKEFQKDARYFKLQKENDGRILAYNYSFDQFENAMNIGNEIRG